MAPSVDFDNLRSITGGDADVESALFASFLATATGCLEKLRKAIEHNDEALWRQQAHTLKGACFNLGANPLGLLCDQAQMDCRATLDEKRVLLRMMEKEFESVQKAIGLEYLT